MSLSAAVNDKDAEEISVVHRPVLLFSGQGSQVNGMGKDVAENVPGAMTLWQCAEKASGLPLREIYWEGDDAAMSDTRALQPALTVANLTLWQALEMRGFPVPMASAGHSLGEFAALAAAGFIAPEDAVRLTAARGQLMADADPEGNGTMAAIVKLPVHDVQEIVAESARESGELLVSANYNTPIQTVISGTKNAVTLAISKAKARKGRGVELKVSGAFHSPLMEEANKKLVPELEKIQWHNGRFPFYANATAKAAYTGTEAKERLLRQMVSPVRWVELLRSLYLAGARWYVEVSPKAVLGKMVGPSLSGVAAEADALRVELADSLANIACLVF